MVTEFKPSAKTLVQEFAERWSRVHLGEIYFVNWGKDVRLMKTLLEVFTYDDILIRVDMYLEDVRQYLIDNGHTIGLFHCSINSYSNAKVKQRKVLQERKNMEESPGKGRVSASEPKPIAKLVQSLLRCNECDQDIIESEWINHMAQHNELRTV